MTEKREAVAWRVRRHDAPNYWIIFQHKPVDALVDPEREVQPLYAAPPAQPARCQICNGDDMQAPCAYPSEGLPGCLRDERRNARKSEFEQSAMGIALVRAWSVGGRTDSVHPDFQAGFEAAWKPAPAQQEPAQPTLMGWVCTDFDGRAGIGFTKEQAKRQAGENCNEYIAIFDNSAPAQEPAQRLSDEKIETLHALHTGWIKCPAGIYHLARAVEAAILAKE
jgi:hypothetical protein